MIKDWKSSGSAGSKIGWLLLEVVVVFIGVYLAFLFDGYRTEQDNEHKQEQIYTSLYKYFYFANEEIKNIEVFDSLYAKPFIESYQNGDKPKLNHLPRFGTGFSDNSWNSMLQAGGIGILKVDFILEVEEIFTYMRFIKGEIENINELSQQFILPNLSKSNSHFYISNSSKLKPEYLWYVKFLSRFPDQMRNLNKKAEVIMGTLENKLSEEKFKKLEKSLQEDS